jgi:hypothetical protein
MNKKTFKLKPTRLLGIWLQIIAVIYFILLFVILVIMPLSEVPDRGELANKYEKIVSLINPYDGLIWMGVFFLGRYIQKN